MPKTRPYPLSACKYCTTNEAEANCFLNDSHFTCRPALKRIRAAQNRWRREFKKRIMSDWNDHTLASPTAILQIVCDYMEGK